jgi:hypothetical protein
MPSGSRSIGLDVSFWRRGMGKGKDEGGMMKDELCYGEDFSGETVRVLKEKEVKQFGEYRTRRLALEAWDRMEEK